MKAQAQGAIMEHNIYLQIWKLDVIYKSNHFARYEIWILYESKQSIYETFFWYSSEYFWCTRKTTFFYWSAFSRFSNDKPANELFECAWPFRGVDTFRGNDCFWSKCRCILTKKKFKFGHFNFQRVQV